jgi:hypothetical protein|tara:strand:+ start:19766 stop:20092 length:327 start_codon:yes stop_codon:yes gene_type:complete
MVIYVDIDETICEYGDVREYTLAYPIPERIDYINSLYDEGNIIVYWTARGCTSKIDHTDLTRSQLEKWGAKYHELKMNSKPYYDLLICDKATNSDKFFSDAFSKKEKQ